MAILLAAYTIYTDALFAVSAISSQLFFTEVQPGPLEYSLYSVVQPLCTVAGQAMFLWIWPAFPFTLETWLITGYAMALLLPFWGMIGFASGSFGWKTRWEFYVSVFVSQLSQACAGTAWKVLLSEMIPVGSEIRCA
ncbi:hypothetical protein LTR81_027005 [Elasticomyces elasticus]